MPKRGSTTPSTPGQHSPAKRKRPVDENVNTTQQPLQQRHQQPKEEEYHKNAGTIMRISVKNFMCHTFLEFDFNENLNMVIGNNGSGKSAIMNAITLTLGGRATSTSRCTNVSRFIQHGKSQSEIAVLLCNEGLEAIDIERYGKSILITRKINIKGQSHYTIKNGGGKTVSELKDTIDQIIAHFNIQVDNPMCMLNQDVAKNFLNTKSDKDKYNFFLKATQLQKMEEDLEENQVEIRQAKKVLNEHIKTVNEMKSKSDELEAQLKFAKSVREAEANVNNLKGQLEWADVFQLEEQLEKANEDGAAQLDVIDKFKEKRDSFKNALANEKTKRDELQHNANEISNSTIEQKRIHDDIEKKVKVFEKQTRSIEAEIKRYENDLQMQNVLKKNIQKKIEESRNQSANNDYEKIRKRIEELDTYISEQRAILSMKENERQNFVQLIDDERQQLNIDNQGVRTAENYCQKRQYQIQNLRLAKNNSKSIYGPYTVNILKTIEKHANKFKEMPIGPVGTHLKVKDRKWSFAIEQCIYFQMTGYICSCREDERLLLEIFSSCIPANEMYQRPSVTVMAYQKSVYKQLKRANTRQPTIFDMLDIDNPTVACHLIDAAKIEQCILLDTTAEGRKIMEHNCPQNCIAAFITDGTQVQGGQLFRIITCKLANPRFFVDDISGQISQAEDDLKLSQNKVNEAKIQVNETQARIQTHLSNTQNLDRTINDIKMKCAKSQKELNELRQRDTPRDSSIDDFESEIDEYDKKIEKIQEKIDEQKLKLNVNDDPEYKKLCNDLAVAKNKVQEKKMELEQCKKSLQECDSLKEHGQRTVDQLEQKLIDMQRLLDNVNYEIQQLKHNYDSKIQQAKQYIKDKPNSNIDSKVVKRNLDSLIKFIETNRSKTQNSDQVQEEYDQLQLQYDTFDFVVSKQRSLIKKLVGAANRRGSEYTALLERTAELTSQCFQSFLESRNYQGEAKFDHEEGTLQLKITPRGDEAHEDTRSLSGGERSFSTVCFMLALWEVVEMPLRCLDEFDVFMDHVTRRTAMKLVLDVAREKQKQYIFLTPQDLSFLKITPDMKILRMPQPKRTLMQRIDDGDDDN